jgi:uncharacterized SAM-binding protein YcdF (DUF218 family)
MDTIFFLLSKLIWLVISPDSLLVILTVISFILLWKKSYKYAQRLLGFVVMLMLIIFLLPIGEWLLYPLETQYRTNPELPQKIDGVILLGGAESAYLSNLWQQTELGESAERDLAFMYFIRQYPDARYVFTGGSGSLDNQEYRQAHVVKKLLLEHGFDISNIIFEEQSRNTYENAKLTYHAIKPGADENWILITTAWHIPRAVGVFHKIGWPVIAFPVDHHTHPGDLLRFNPGFTGNLHTLGIAIKEWTGLAAYWITGKLVVTIPDNN